MFDRLELYPDYERAVQEIGIPFFQAVGNHDLNYAARDGESPSTTFSRYFGPRYYSFDRGDVHYIVMDDVFRTGADFIGYVDTDQLTWLSNGLAFVERGRTVIVTMHIPTLGSRHERDGTASPDPKATVVNRDALYRAFEPYRAHIVCGHTHECEHIFTNGVHEHVLGTVCGAWWTGPICSDGTPNGYAIFEVNGEDVRWRYRATSHAADHQIRLYPRAPTATTRVS